jgi:hypothetical protein
MTSIAQEIIARTDEWDFGIPKETINRVKRQHTEGEKVSVRYSSNRGLISRIYKKN